jgi:hypothetical protein
MDTLSDIFASPAVINQNINLNIKSLKKSKPIYEDTYTCDVLRERYNLYNRNYNEESELINKTVLPIRRQNMPEDMSENIAKFIIRKHDNDPSCKWSKCMKQSGDLCSEKYNGKSQIEIKSFTSPGPSSFGPKKIFSVIYFLDMQKWLEDIIILYRVNLTNESLEWNNIKMNKDDTFEKHCSQKRRPHISYHDIYKQIPTYCVKIYEGSFEGIF